MANKYQTRMSGGVKQILALAVISTMTMVTYFIANKYIQSQINYSASAASGNATLFFEPDKITLPPTTKLNVWATTDKQLSFAHLELTFDRTKFQLSQEVILNNTILSRKVRVTSMADANASGRVVIALGVEPTTQSNAPVGTTSLASIYIKSVSSTANDQATLSFDTVKSLLVDNAATPFNLSAATALVTLNPSVTPTNTPSPNVLDTTAPTLTITSPISGAKVTKGSFTIAASASDASGISTIQLLIDGKTLTSCSNSNTCQTSHNANKLSRGSHTITAIAKDASSQSNSQEVSIIITK